MNDTDVNHLKTSKYVSVDWKFWYPDPNSTDWGIEIMTGTYKGLKIKYYDARVEHVNGVENAQLFFSFNVIEQPLIPNQDVSPANKELMHILGNILASIVVTLAKTNLK